MKIDPLKGWHRYTELMNQQEDPRFRAMLDNMRHHLKYECLGDPEIFNTMVPEPDYRFYPAFGASVLQGMPAIKDFYHNMWDGCQSLVELAIHRCAPGDWGVACDGEWLQQIPGETLIADGNEDVDADAWYISHAHLAWFFKHSRHTLDVAILSLQIEGTALANERESSLTDTTLAILVRCVAQLATV